MVYSLSDSGTLSGGGGTVFSTSPGTVYQRFNASSNIQSIYATWQVSNQTSMWSNHPYKTLVWNNNLFSNNTAAFCVIHGVLRVYFLFPPLPDCMPVNLAILPCMVTNPVHNFTILTGSSVSMQKPAYSADSIRHCGTVHERVGQRPNYLPTRSHLRNTTEISPRLILDMWINNRYLMEPCNVTYSPFRHSPRKHPLRQLRKIPIRSEASSTLI